VGGAGAPSSPVPGSRRFRVHATSPATSRILASDRRLAPSPWPLDRPATTTRIKSARGVSAGSASRLLTRAALAWVWQLSGRQGRCGDVRSGCGVVKERTADPSCGNAQSSGAGQSAAGSSSRSLDVRCRPRTTSVSRFAGSIWRMNSRQRPHGGKTCNGPWSSPRQTATIFAILYSRAVTIAAMAACSAQNPVPDAVSMHTPTYTLPVSVMRADATSPKSRSPTW
jgi:hypothetical protein